LHKLQQVTHQTGLKRQWQRKRTPNTF